MKKIKNNQGQIAIIVLLVSAVLLTLGMSASRKTITDTKVDTDEELLKEAFNSAESGINNYLSVGSTTYSDSSGNNATVFKTNIGGGSSLASEGLIPSGSNQLFWLVNHKDDGGISSTYYSGSNINISVDSDFGGALKVDYFYIAADGSYQVQRSGYNFKGNNTVTNYTPNASNEIPLTLPGSRLLLVATPIGSSTNIVLEGSSSFPLQGEELTAVGTAGDGVKTQVRTRNVYQLPQFFIDAITAQNTIQ